MPEIEEITPESERRHLLWRIGFGTVTLAGAAFWVSQDKRGAARLWTVCKFGAVAIPLFRYLKSEYDEYQLEELPVRDALSLISDPADLEACSSGLAALKELFGSDAKKSSGSDGDNQHRIQEGAPRYLAAILDYSHQDPAALDVIKNVMIMINRCAKDVKGRRLLSKAGTTRVILKKLSELANSSAKGSATTRGELANLLGRITSVDATSCVLPSDNPKGADCAMELVKQKHFPKLVQSLSDPDTLDNDEYISGILWALSNIANIKEGPAALLNAGVMSDGIVKLLGHDDRAVVMHATGMIYAMMKRHRPSFDAFCSLDGSVPKVVDVIRTYVSQGARGVPQVTNAVDIVDLIRKTGSIKQKGFVLSKLNPSGFEALLLVDLKMPVPELREQAREILRVVSQETTDTFATAVAQIKDKYSKEINLRKRQDQEEEHKKAMARRQQLEIVRRMFGEEHEEEMMEELEHNPQLQQQLKMWYQMAQSGGGGMGGMGGMGMM